MLSGCHTPPPWAISATSQSGLCIVERLKDFVCAAVQRPKTPLPCCLLTVILTRYFVSRVSSRASYRQNSCDTSCVEGCPSWSFRGVECGWCPWPRTELCDRSVRRLQILVHCLLTLDIATTPLFYARPSICSFCLAFFMGTESALVHSAFPVDHRSEVQMEIYTLRHLVDLFYRGYLQ